MAAVSVSRVDLACAGCSPSSGWVKWVSLKRIRLERAIKSPHIISRWGRFHMDAEAV